MTKKTSQFEKDAAGKPAGLLTELLEFLQHTKKWWLMPILIVILVLGTLVFLGGTGAAPFIYTLF